MATGGSTNAPANVTELMEAGMARMGQQADALAEEKAPDPPKFQGAKCILAWLFTALGIVVAIISGERASKNDSILPWVCVFAVVNVLLSIWANLSAPSLRHYADCSKSSKRVKLLYTAGVLIWMSLTIIFVIFAWQDQKKERSKRCHCFLWPAQVFSAILSVGGNIVQEEMQALLGKIVDDVFQFIEERCSPSATVLTSIQE